MKVFVLYFIMVLAVSNLKWAGVQFKGLFCKLLFFETIGFSELFTELRNIDFLGLYRCFIFGIASIYSRP